MIEMVIEYIEDGKTKYSIVYEKKTVMVEELPQTAKDFIKDADFYVRRGVFGAEKVYTK